MSERPKQEWRIDANLNGQTSTIKLNGEVFPHVHRATLQVGGHEITKLILELNARHVEVIANPELHLIVGGHRFKVIDACEPGHLQTHPSMPWCQCGHLLRAHERFADGSYGACVSHLERDCPCHVFKVEEEGDLDDGLFRAPGMAD